MLWKVFWKLGQTRSNLLPIMSEVSSFTFSPYRIRDKNGDVVYDIIVSGDKDLDTALKSAVRKAEAEASVVPGDIANGKYTTMTRSS